MNFRVNSFRFLFFCFLFLTPSVFAQEKSLPNVIYVSFDGLSPSTLFKIMQQKRIPHFNQMGRTGSKSVLKGVLAKPNLKDALAVMWTGYPIEVGMSRHDSAFVFNRIKREVPDLTSTVIISRPKRESEKEKPWGTILKRSLTGVDQVHEEKERTSDEITQLIVESVQTSKGPFIIFANYPLCAQMALNYREGCDRYASAVLYLNKQLGVVQDALKKKGIQDQTVFVLTASYSFMEGTSYPSSKTWVISSKKLRQGKSQLDLVPTLYDLYNVSYSGFDPKFSGKSLL